MESSFQWLSVIIEANPHKKGKARRRIEGRERDGKQFSVTFSSE